MGAFNTIQQCQHTTNLWVTFWRARPPNGSFHNHRMVLVLLKRTRYGAPVCNIISILWKMKFHVIGCSLRNQARRVTTKRSILTNHEPYMLNQLKGLQWDSSFKKFTVQNFCHLVWDQNADSNASGRLRTNRKFKFSLSSIQDSQIIQIFGQHHHLR